HRMQWVESAQLNPGQDLEPAIEMLHQRGTALDPIAVVAIQHAADVAYFGMMNMAADDPVHAAGACFRGDRVGEIADELHRVLDLEFEIGGERPIGIAETAAHKVEPAIEA